jgi:hypothetical protein
VKNLSFVVLLACIAMLFLSCNTVSAQETIATDPIITTGIADIKGGSIIRARNKAIADAQKKALMEAVGMLMTFDRIEKQFALFKSALFDRADYFIESYKVLYDNTLDDRYHISLQSTIAFEALKDYLVNRKSLAPRPKLPRILLMISQQRLNQDFYTCWWSFIDPVKELTTIDQMVRNELQKAGFEVIDHTLMVPKRMTGVYGCLDIGPEAMQALGAQFQANIVIAGNAQVVVTTENEDRSHKVIQASITAQAIKIGDGSLLATGEVYFPSSEGSEEAAQEISLKKASLAFARQMSDKISRQWVKETKGIGSTTLSISGLSDYLDFSRLKSDLKKRIPEIHNLSQKTLSDTGALIEVESSLDTPSLAALIEKNQFEDFIVFISGIDPPLIELRDCFVVPPRRVSSQ